MRYTAAFPLRHATVLFLAMFAILATSPDPARTAEPDRLWAALRSGGAFAMIRHALAPGTGDPAGFDVDDCGTQRNLSDEGRRQAMSIGARFRANGISQADVFSSAWCRCRDTARLMELGPVEILAPLNSFFGDPARREPQTDALAAWLAAREGEAPLVLVTHQVNISALAGVYTRSGEIVVLRRKADGGITVLGTL